MNRMSLEEAKQIISRFGIEVIKNPEFKPHKHSHTEGKRYILRAGGEQKLMETGFEVTELAKWMCKEYATLARCEVRPEGLLYISNYQHFWQSTHTYAQNKFKVEKFVTRRDTVKRKEEEF